MLRTIFAAAAALTLAAPAFAQDTSLLTGEPWECRGISLVGNPDSDLMLGFGDGGVMMINFYMEMPIENDLVSVEFELGGTWTVDGNMVTINAPDFSLLDAWVNGEPADAELYGALASGLATEFANYSGQDEIAYISEHAMVLKEAETSVSCWR